MQKLASKRLMENLTGKETFAAIMQSYADMLQLKPATFSDEALDRAKAGLRKRPEEDRNFYRWCNAKLAIDYLVTEIRVDAMQANWHISLLIGFLHNTMLTDASNSKSPEEIKKLAERVEYRLHKLMHYIAALDAFSDTLNVDLTPLLRDGINNLNEHLELYQTMRELYDDYLSMRSDPPEVITGYLPKLKLEANDTVKQKQARLTESLNHMRGDEFVSVMVPLIEASVMENSIK